MILKTVVALPKSVVTPGQARPSPLTLPFPKGRGQGEGGDRFDRLSTAGFWLIVMTRGTQGNTQPVDLPLRASQLFGGRADIARHPDHRRRPAWRSVSRHPPHSSRRPLSRCGRGHADVVILAEAGEGFQDAMAAPGRPLVVLLAGHGDQQSVNGGPVGEEASHVGAPQDLTGEMLQGGWCYGSCITAPFGRQYGPGHLPQPRLLAVTMAIDLDFRSLPSLGGRPLPPTDSPPCFDSTTAIQVVVLKGRPGAKVGAHGASG